MVRRACAILILFLAAAGACTDSDGNRITVQRWFESAWGNHEENNTDARLAQTREQNRQETTPDADAASPTSPTDTAPDSQPPAEQPGDTGESDLKPAPAAPPRGAVTAAGLTIHDDVITVSDILEPLESQLRELAAELPPDAYYRQAAQIIRLQIVETMAQHLIWNRAKSLITDEIQPRLDSAVDKMEKDRINREFNGRETEYEVFLTSHGMNRTDVRKRLERSIVIDTYLRDRLLELIPPPRKRELREYYDAHIRDYSRPERREMFVIDIPSRAFLEGRSFYAPRSHEKVAARRKARAAAEDAARALADGTPFEQVAEKFSHGPHRADGGAWGWITAPADSDEPPLRGRWQQVSHRLFKLDEGQISEIIESPESDTFFIVKVGRIEPAATRSFQDVQPEIVEALRRQRFARRRSEFLQKELESCLTCPTTAALDEFMRRALRSAPAPARGAALGKLSRP